VGYRPEVPGATGARIAPVERVPLVRGRRVHSGALDKPNDAVSEALLGSVLDGRYRVIRKVAEGGMGAVYEAEQIALGRRVAIKTLHAHLANDEEMVVRFRREAMATTKIGHPNIVEVVDLGELPGGFLYLVLEFLEGRDLSRLLKAEGPLSIGRACRILLQVCDGMGAAHVHGIVHRDLKPENVFLVEGSQPATAADRVKVVDFGVSKIKEAGVDSKTRTGTALGTPYYMAPEQAQGLKTVDHRADIYAIGVMLYRMLTGHYPFDDESYPMLVIKICTEAPPPASTWRADIPEGLADLLDRTLSKDPGERPADCAALANELRRYTTLDAPPAMTGAPAPVASKPRLLSTDRHDPLGPTLLGPSARRPAPVIEDPEADAAEERLKPRTNAMLPWGVGLMALLTVGVVIYAVAGPSDDAANPDDDIEIVPLPEPGPPLLRPFGRGDSSGGWSWRNPVPRGMPTWFAASVGGPGLIALAGEHGVAARYVNDTSLVVWRTGVTEPLYGIDWTGGDQALAVGANGTLVRLTPTGPVPLDAGSTNTLRAVATISATEALVVGDGGLVLRVVGDRIVTLDVNTTTGFTAVHQRRSEVFVAGGGGEILRFTDLRSGRFVRESTATANLRAIGGCERGELYAAGERGFLARRRRGTWQTLRVTGEPRATFTAITCDRGRAVLTASDGHVYLASGDRTVMLETEFEQPLNGVSGSDDAVTWICGAGGHLATLDVDHVTTRVAGPVGSLRDVASIGGALIAVGEWGRIIRETRDAFVQGESPTDAGLAALAQLNDRELVAVGDSGALVRIDYQSAELLHFPDTASSLRDVLADDGEVLVVGTGGTIAYGPLEALRLRSMPEGEGVDLWSLTGTAGDALVVGDHALVAPIIGGRIGERIDCGVGNVVLRSVHRDVSGVAYAVGDAGLVVRIEGELCTVERTAIEGGSNLNAVGPSPDGQILAVGDDGVALLRSADGTWISTDLGVTHEHLRGLHAGPRGVQVVGTGGTILEHVRIDGR